jgi:3-methyladenine DNA glycosylase/8-oxoguanine DNA glycosylase
VTARGEAPDRPARGAAPARRVPARHGAAPRAGLSGVPTPGEAARGGFVLVRETVEPRWAPYRLGRLPGGVARRRGNGVVRLVHVGGEPVVVAVAGTVFAARARSEATAREGLARVRFATGIDDDLAGFHGRFRDDPWLGRALRADRAVRVRRNPSPWEALMWAITEQLIDMPRALAIQRRMTARFGRRFDGLYDTPSVETIAAAAPAELEACGLHAKRALAMIRCAREVAAGRVDWHGDLSRLDAIPEIGTWTLENLQLYGLGRLDVVPAGDLGYLKLVGRLVTGRPKAIADEAEVRGFFAPYAPYAGLAASYLIRARTIPSPRRAGTRSSAGTPPRAAA